MSKRTLKISVVHDLSSNWTNSPHELQCAVVGNIIIVCHEARANELADAGCKYGIARALRGRTNVDLHISSEDADSGKVRSHCKNARNDITGRKPLPDSMLLHAPVNKGQVNGTRNIGRCEDEDVLMAGDRSSESNATLSCVPVSRGGTTTRSLNWSYLRSWSICVSSALTTRMASEGSLPLAAACRAAARLST